MTDLDNLDRFELVVLARRERGTGAHRSYRILYDGDMPYLDTDMMDTRRLSRRRVEDLRCKVGYDVPRSARD